MAVLSRTLLLASAVAGLASAQTIQVDGGGSADETTVPVAAEQVGNELILTDEILAQLASQELANVSLFEFPEHVEETENDKRSIFTGCKTYPGDLLWPLKPVWKIFDLLTGSALIKTVPIGAACYKNSEHYDAAKCAEILANWNESPTQ
ncbi:hypothetical protein NUW58_g600 [Xylaria curta]|uniref:Uncharacterized protein n=1 Tax=Xylaria curta TaxID=42375 RepID=A0ACC1PNS4_9PEZI|nr:hypothetical protein NUW58_g600 [Xylaria curta]